MADYLYAETPDEYFKQQKRFIRSVPTVIGNRVMVAATKTQTEFLLKKIKRTKKFKDKTGNLRWSIQSRYISMSFGHGFKSVKKGIGIVGVYTNKGSHFWNVERGHKKGIVTKPNRQGNFRGGWGPAKGRDFFFSTFYQFYPESIRKWIKRFDAKKDLEMRKLAKKHGLT